MTLPNLPGQRHANTRANLQRACEELRYYAGKVGENLQISLRDRMRLLSNAELLISEIETANPETANELFKQAHRLCAEMEEILKLCSK